MTNNENNACNGTTIDDSDESMLKIGSDLIKYRESKKPKWSQVKLAQKLDMSPSTISQAETIRKDKPLSPIFWMKWREAKRRRDV